MGSLGKGSEDLKRRKDLGKTERREGKRKKYKENVSEREKKRWI